MRVTLLIFSLFLFETAYAVGSAGGSESCDTKADKYMAYMDGVQQYAEADEGVISDAGHAMAGPDPAAYLPADALETTGDLNGTNWDSVQKPYDKLAQKCKSACDDAAKNAEANHHPNNKTNADNKEQQCEQKVAALKQRAATQSQQSKDAAAAAAQTKGKAASFPIVTGIQ